MHLFASSVVCPIVFLALAAIPACSGAMGSVANPDGGRSASDATSDAPSEGSAKASSCSGGCIEKDGTCYTGGSDNAHCGGSYGGGGNPCLDCGNVATCLFYAGVDGPACVCGSSAGGSGGLWPVGRLGGRLRLVDRKLRLVRRRLRLGNSGYASLCPVFSNQPTCPSASDANGCDLSFGTNCAADALPQGFACAGTTQCQARIGPVDGCGRVDGWICSCIGGRWSCDDCAEGAALCEGGAAAYELPDGGDP
jgi:hypothetical protein